MKRGFSLIEILIAGALLAIMGVLLMTTLNSSIEVKDRVDVISNRYYLIRQSMSRMTREISMAYISAQKNPNYAVVNTQFKGEKSSLSFVAFGGFVRMKDAKESDQREITYYIQTDIRKGSAALMRKEKVNPTAFIGKEGRVQVLCPNIKSIHFKYWNHQMKNWEDEWRTEGMNARSDLPLRVLIEIVAILENKVEQKFVTQTEIMITNPIKIL
jgi:general secretion pathway protein J